MVGERRATTGPRNSTPKAGRRRVFSFRGIRLAVDDDTSTSDGGVFVARNRGTAKNNEVVKLGCMNQISVKAYAAAVHSLVSAREPHAMTCTSPVALDPNVVHFPFHCSQT
jgi:hypothetical protein